MWEILSTWRYRKSKRLLEAELTEERSTQFALEPMLLAERDRAYIKRLKVYHLLIIYIEYYGP